MTNKEAMKKRGWKKPEDLFLTPQYTPQKRIKKMSSSFTNHEFLKELRAENLREINQRGKNNDK